MNQIAIDSQHVVTTFLVVFDLTGTFIFALSGAIAAVKHRLDAFGVLFYASLPATRVALRATL